MWLAAGRTGCWVHWAFVARVVVVAAVARVVVVVTVVVARAVSLRFRLFFSLFL